MTLFHFSRSDTKNFSASAGEPPSVAYRRLRREMLNEERSTFVNRRDSGAIDDEVLRRVLRRLDFEEAMLSRDET